MKTVQGMCIFLSTIRLELSDPKWACKSLFMQAVFLGKMICETKP